MEDGGESNADRVLCSFSGCGIFRGFVVCIAGKMAQDVGMVESILVSSPSSLVGFSSLHVLVFIPKTFCDFKLSSFFDLSVCTIVWIPIIHHSSGSSLLFITSVHIYALKPLLLKTDKRQD